MTELQHIGQYVRILKPHLPKEIFAPVPTRLWWILPYLGGAIPLGYGIVFAAWLWPVKILASLLMGLCFGGLGLLAHEILHGSVVKTPWLRDVLGGLCFVIFCTSAKVWRKWHNVDHHGQTQIPGLDPDAFETFENYQRHTGFNLLNAMPPKLRSLINFVSFTVWFSVLCALMVRTYKKSFNPQELRVVYLQTAIPWLFWLLVLIAFGPANFVFLFILPALVANALVMGYIATNHMLNPLNHTNDPLENSLSIANPAWLDFFHLNFSYHVEHHLFPSMNPVHAPKLRAVLLKLYPTRYKSLSWFVALRGLWNTPRLYGEDMVSLVSPEGLEFGTLGHGLNPDKILPRNKEPSSKEPRHKE